MSFFRNNNSIFIILIGVVGLMRAQNPPTQWVQLQDTVYQVQKGRNTITLKFVIAHGYHIQANEEVMDWVLPSKLEMDSINGVSAVSMYFPKAHDFYLLGIDAPLKVFSNTLVVELEFEITETYDSSILWNGGLSYQACDGKQCFYPRTLPFTLQLAFY